MNKYKLTTLAILSILLSACVNFSGAIVTITSVVDSASKNYAHEYNLGHVPEDIDKKVELAHAQYRNASAVCQQALIAYKNNEDKTSYVRALETVRATATNILDLITPYIETQQLKTQLAKATKL